MNDALYKYHHVQQPIKLTVQFTVISAPFLSKNSLYIGCIYSAAAPAVLGQQVETKNDEAAWISGERSSNNGKLQLQMNEQ